MNWSKKDCALCGNAKFEQIGEQEFKCPDCGWQFKILDSKPDVGRLLIESFGDYEVWEGVDFQTLNVGGSLTFLSKEEAKRYFTLPGRLTE